jgi:hypothetical protein
VNECSDQVVEEIEEEPAPQDVVAGPVPGEEDEGKKKRRPDLPLEMLFREAEVIAHNLKESGTRR